MLQNIETLLAKWCWNFQIRFRKAWPEFMQTNMKQYNQTESNSGNISNLFNSKCGSQTPFWHEDPLVVPPFERQFYSRPLGVLFELLKSNQ